VSHPISEASIGFAIFGTGAAARSHAAAVEQCAGAHLVGCLGRRPELVKVFAQDFHCRGETYPEAFLRDPDVRAVIVATEPSRHGMAIAVARSGKHVLIEKPLAASWEEGAAIARACEEAKVVASVVSQRRFEDGLARVRACLQDGAIGRPLFVEILRLTARGDEYYRAGNGWRESSVGGITMNLLIHDIDRLLDLFGSVRTVQAHLAPTPSSHQPDRRASILIAFDNGVQGIVRGSSQLRRNFGQLLNVFGEEGMLRMQDERVIVTPHPLGAEGRAARARRLAADLCPGGRRPTKASRLDPFVRQLGDFLGAIRTGSKPGVSVGDGLAALRVVLAAHESQITGCTVDLTEPSSA
jgi:UDP-N-acetyl-2-amino-2-deoxyglucuronate dehydrogenase